MDRSERAIGAAEARQQRADVVQQSLAVGLKARIREKREKNRETIKKYEAEIQDLLPKKERSDLALQNYKADLDSKTSFYDIETEHNGANSARAKALKQEIEELRKKVAATRDESDKFADEIKKIQRSRDELEQAQVRIMENAWSFPIYNFARLFAANAQVKGFRTHPLGSYPYLYEVSLG